MSDYGSRCKKCNTGTTYRLKAGLCDSCAPQTSDEKQIKIMKQFVEVDAPKFVKESKGTKFDDGKPKLSINPPEALELMAQAFEFGSKKYGRGNYKQGLEYTRLLDSAMRHLTAFASGENNDPESSLSHVAHTLSCLAMLAYTIKHHPNLDDRK